MTSYISDKEEIEMIRNWWRENGKFTLFCIIAVLMISAGWRYWQNHVEQDRAAASMLYEQMLSHQANNDLSSVEFEVTDLLTNHPKTPYASLAAFMSAQNAINGDNLASAIEKFDWVIGNAKNKDFKETAKIRKARVLLTMKKYDDALAVLAKSEVTAYAPLVSEVKGDILVAKGDKKSALLAYAAALQTLKKDEPNRSFLQMKFDQLSG